MFKGFTKDLAGTADICSAVIDPSKLLVGPYLLPQEEVLFAFQSAKEEFVFTNEALITVEGENATTTRKLVERYEYRDCQVSDVQFETTGRIDRDCEIKFRIGAKEISIDIARKEEEAVKVYYKALVALAREQQERQRNWQFAKDGVTTTTKTLKLNGHNKQADALTSQANDVLVWMQADYQRLNSRCYRDVLKQALQTAQ